MNSGYWATEPGLGSHTVIFRLPRIDAFAPDGQIRIRTIATDWLRTSGFAASDMID
jgi:hypothetical protein